jgi:predicted double-glycine peptidase
MICVGNKRRWGWAAVLAVFFGWPAAADIISLPGGAIYNVPRKSVVDLRYTNVVRQRFDLSCGAAAVATLLNHFYGENLDERETIDAILKFGDKAKIEKDGFSMLELKRFGDSKGYVVQGFKITKPDAITELKIPFLTLINTRGYNHFVVVKGTKDGVVYIADPAFGNRSRPLAEFKEEWSNIILVYLSRTKKPQNQFALDAGIKAPTNQVVQLLDRYLTVIRPGGNQF